MPSEGSDDSAAGSVSSASAASLATAPGDRPRASPSTPGFGTGAFGPGVPGLSGPGGFGPGGFGPGRFGPGPPGGFDGFGREGLGPSGAVGYSEPFGGDAGDSAAELRRRAAQNDAERRARMEDLQRRLAQTAGPQRAAAAATTAAAPTATAARATAARAPPPTVAESLGAPGAGQGEEPAVGEGRSGPTFRQLYDSQAALLRLMEQPVSAKAALALLLVKRWVLRRLTAYNSRRETLLRRYHPALGAAPAGEAPPPMPAAAVAAFRAEDAELLKSRAGAPPKTQISIEDLGGEVRLPPNDLESLAWLVRE